MSITAKLKAKPTADILQAWLLVQQRCVPEGSATACAIDYSRNHRRSYRRYLCDGRLPPDNNLIENHIRPIASGIANRLFAGSLHDGSLRAGSVLR